MRGAYSSVCVYIWAANCRGFIQLSRKLSQKLECQESEGWGWWGRQCQPELITPPHLLKPLDETAQGWPLQDTYSHVLGWGFIHVFRNTFLTYQFSCPNTLDQFLYMTFSLLWNKSEDQAETVIPNVALSARMKIHSENETMRRDREEQGVGDRGWDSIMRCDHC